jgi:hypothetical protein
MQMRGLGINVVVVAVSAAAGENDASVDGT